MAALPLESLCPRLSVSSPDSQFRDPEFASRNEYFISSSESSSLSLSFIMQASTCSFHQQCTDSTPQPRRNFTFSTQDGSAHAKEKGTEDLRIAQGTGNVALGCALILHTVLQLEPRTVRAEIPPRSCSDIVQTTGRYWHDAGRHQWRATMRIRNFLDWGIETLVPALSKRVR